MSYRDLTKESGGSADGRLSEARRILKMLDDVSQSVFTNSEFQFIESMDIAGSVSTKQLFWLRDIKDKYL